MLDWNAPSIAFYQSIGAEVMDDWRICRLSGEALQAFAGAGGTLMQIVLVAAVGENNVIGRDGQLPWRLKSDLQHFRQVTLNRPVIMGRKTYESIGKPLKGRTNIVLTRDFRLTAPGHGAGAPAWTRRSPLRAGRRQARRRRDHGDRRQRRLRRHHGAGGPAGDHPCACRAGGRSLFPPIDPAVWREVTRAEYPAGPDDSASFAVAAYLRR